MNGSLFYGLKGRIISGVAFVAGVLSAAVSASQQANLVSIFPPSYNKYFAAAAIASLSVTAFSERLTGGASNPEVRAAAEASDRKNAIEELNK